MKTFHEPSSSTSVDEERVRLRVARNVRRSVGPVGVIVEV